MGEDMSAADNLATRAENDAAMGRLLKAAKANLEAMTPAERAAMYEAQRQSWVRAEAELSNIDREEGRD